MRQGIELLPPLVTDMNGGASILTIIRQTPVVVGCLYEGLGVLKVERVHHVEKVLPVRPSALGKLVREVGHEASVIFELWVELVDAELVILGHIYLPLFSKSEKLFLL